ncbi:MAG: GTPase HflX [Chloroflexota bacterium]
MSTKSSLERAFLIAVPDDSHAGGWSADESLDELARLASTARANVVGRLIQKLHTPTRNYYLGKGKLEELVALKEKINYNVAIFDDELTPLQQQNLEDSLKVKVIDRVALILDIFARHAHTHEGKLQVELAQHRYLLPRLAGQWSHLERLGGGIGTRGPGESQLETDRRLIRKKISNLEKQIGHVKKHRMLYRQKRKRSGIPIVALVGYTNAGKSTLLNTLSRSDVTVEDKLFATLDPTARRMGLPDKSIILLSDTVGFIKKLPPMVITAFRATLEELAEASILLHIVDLSSANAAEQCQVVEEILKDLNINDKPRITVLNKIDLLLEKGEDKEKVLDYTSATTPVFENTIMVSAKKGWGLDNLLKSINQAIKDTVIPFPKNTP